MRNVALERKEYIMQRNVKARLAAFGASIAVLGAVAVSAAGTTGAYFSDTHSGTVSGTVGSIKITTSGGSGTDGLNLAYTNLLPGEKQTVTAHFQNTGLNAEDVWVVFPNAVALHALNDLGHFGEFHIAGDGVAKFDSANLSDGLETGRCGALSPTGCWPVPQMLKVASNVAPNNTVHNVDFTFNYSSNLSGQTAAGGGVWNVYPPLPLICHDGTAANNVVPCPAAGPEQASSGNGLPYELVATQVGQTP